MSNLQKYGEYTVESAEEEQKQIDESSSVDYLKLSVGRNVVRFLPPPVGKTSPFKIVQQHFLKLPGMPSPVKFACPRYLKPSGHCIVCAKANELYRSGNSADKERGYELFPKRRVYANVIDRSNQEKGPIILEMGKTIHEPLVKIRKNEDIGGNYTHPDEGFDIVIDRVGTSKNDTKYTVIPARKSSPLGNLEWVEQQHDLDRYSKQHTDAEIREMIGAPASEESSSAPEPEGATSDDFIDVESEPAEGEDNIKW
ncbi:hypothetical protein LCGC14_0455460 [marine sediment metagenome]|uniref:Bacteriophage T4 Gp32 single-stranded DNA-binding domain-containing protein n=1 Tax=marine sediment metagenome TaxID=412755 RepID=A0A0F9SGH9_9ZZZZ